MEEFTVTMKKVKTTSGGKAAYKGKDPRCNSIYLDAEILDGGAAEEIEITVKGVD